MKPGNGVADEFESLLRRARALAVPIVVVTTPDQNAAIARLGALAATCPKREKGGENPVLRWDLVGAMQAVNDAGAKTLARIVGNRDAVSITDKATRALAEALRIEEGGILFMVNAHRLIEERAVSQGVHNLRDAFKADGRTLVLMGPVMKLPAELQGDVLTLDEPLPTEKELTRIVAKQFEDAGLKEPDETTAGRAVDGVLGLSKFAAEQATALSFTRTGLDLDRLWERKRSMIEQTKGLGVYRGKETFDQIGGLGRARKFGQGLFGGSKRPRAIVWIDEIEKALAGAAGSVSDGTGVSQDALGVLLREMEDRGWPGILTVGPPGSGKSLYAKALGNSYNVPTISLDLGAMKGSLVGESEQAIRQGVKVIRAIAGDGAFFVASCNRLESLPPELKRRFRLGIWYFDLPTEEEREAIWRVNLARYGIEKQELPDDTNWVGADVRNTCEVAQALGCSLKEAADYIVPVYQADPNAVERLRSLADGRFLSASSPGVYRKPKDVTARAGRKLNVSEV